MNIDALPRLAVVVTHPIQYQTPLWQAMANSNLIEVKVFYASRYGVEDHFDPLYGRSFSWNISLVDGYEHEFLSSINVPCIPGPVSNRYPLGIRRHLGEGGFDAVLLHGYMNAAAWAGYVAAKRLHIPVLLRGDSHLHRSRRPLVLRAKALALGGFLRGVSCCFAIGEWNREYWRHYGIPEGRIRTTLYAIDNKRFRDTSISQSQRICELRLEWGISESDTVFVFVGNFQHHKGIDVLLDAFIRLRGLRKDVHLVLIGEGVQMKNLQDSVAGVGGIHWTGFINQAELPIYLTAADVFVLPSRIEPWGLVVNEAMACGLPCIVSSAVGAGPDLVNGPDTGRVVPVDDVSALAASMNEACSTELRVQWCERIASVLKRASYEDNVKVISDCLIALRKDKGKRDGSCVS